MSYERHLAANARLVILRTLRDDVAGTGNDAMLQVALETYGIRRSRDYCRTQLRALAELGAVTISEAGTAMMAAITRQGIDHVERRAVIEGVLRPSPEA